MDETKTSDAQPLSADLPVQHPDRDALGYAPFAQNLARALESMTPTDGIVLAVHGAWGSGKSTVLNFVTHFLQESDSTNHFLVLRFNPWWFSGREDLTRLFFAQLRARLGDKDYGEIKARIADLAEILAKLPYAGGAEIVADKLREQPDIVALKEKIGQLLRDSGHKLLVLIDDIDRLTAPEIRDLFRTVKAVCNFPNVVYLLAFDKEIVASALEKEQHVPGRDYLEKIVQVPFELPLPDRAALRRMLFAELEEVLADTPEDDFESSYWANVYFDGIDPFIETPRDIVRLVNALRVTYPAVVGEVNPVDFVAIESLRVFSPRTYDVIRARSSLFVGASIGDGHQRQIDTEKEEHDAWLAQLSEDERQNVVRLLRRIFPKFAHRLGGAGHGSEWGKHWRRDRRVCSEEIFPVYFRLAVPKSLVSRAEMQALLDAADNAESFSDELIRLADEHQPDGKTRLRSVLQRLWDYTESEIEENDIPTIVEAMVSVGDQLIRPEDERTGMFDILGTDLMIWFHVRNLLLRLESSSRVDILAQTLEQSRSVSTVVNIASNLAYQYEPDRKDPVPPEERVVPEESLPRVTDIALKQIRDAASNGLLLRSPNLTHTLHRWKGWASGDEVRQWAASAIESDDDLLTFVDAFLNVRWVQGLGIMAGEGDVAARKYNRLDPKWLTDFIDPETIVNRLRNIVSDENIPETKKTSALQLLKEYDLRQEGKNPDSELR